MSLHIHLVLLQLLYLCSPTNQQLCSTKNHNGPVAPTCQFPYRLPSSPDQLHFSCSTSVFPNSSLAQCPTAPPDPESLVANLSPDSWGHCGDDCPLMHYHTNSEIRNKLQEMSSQFPDLSQVFVIGTSVLGQPLMGIRISRDVRRSRSLLKPMVRYIGNMRGNEVMSREILVQLAYSLLHGYDKDDRIRRLVDNTDISILPTANTDGFDRANRRKDCNGKGYKFGSENENRVDINRNFPNAKEKERFDTDYDYDVFDNREPETIALMNWSANEPFVLSASFGDGGVVVTYPYDHDRSRPLGQRRVPQPNTTPDQDIFHHLALTYASNHATMVNGTECYRKSSTGISNGADWNGRHSRHPVEGTLSDFSYMFTSNTEISVSMTCCKFPSRSFINREWENNRESLLTYLEQVHRGVKGLVLFNNGPVSGADIIVYEHDNTIRKRNVSSNIDGEYWRILLPNRYSVQAVYDDCRQSGNKYISTKHKILLSEKIPLVEQILVLNPTGIPCGGRAPVFNASPSTEAPVFNPVPSTETGSGDHEDDYHIKETNIDDYHIYEDTA